LIAARFKYFLEGRSAAVAINAAHKQSTRSFSIQESYQAGVVDNRLSFG
jgi:hypothetical protein